MFNKPARIRPRMVGPAVINLLRPSRPADKGGFFRTAHERDIAFSADSRFAAGLTLALVLLGTQAVAGGGMRRESA